MNFNELPSDAIPKFMETGTRAFIVEVPDGLIQMFVAVEPYNDDGSSGLHVSVSHSAGRKPTDDEMGSVKIRFYQSQGKNCEEQNCGTNGSPIRHLWEIA